MRTKKIYVIPSVKVIQVETSAILVNSPTAEDNILLDIDLVIEEDGYAD